LDRGNSDIHERLQSTSIMATGIEPGKARHGMYQRRPARLPADADLRRWKA
jgi:hypothetical protein